MFMFLKATHASTAKGTNVKIHKQAAIRTVKVFLSIITISILTSLSLIFIPMHLLLGFLGFSIFGGMIYMIYKVSLDQIEFEEKSIQREHLWKKMDEERYGSKLHKTDD